MASSSRRILFSIVLVSLALRLHGRGFRDSDSSAVSPSSDGDVRDNLKAFTQVYGIVEENYAETGGRG